jgi:hypothetical protein
MQSADGRLVRDDCTVPGDVAATPLSADLFREGLLDFRTRIQAAGSNFGTYFIPSTVHVWTDSSRFYDTTVGGVRLVDWYRDVIEGAPAHVGP